MPDLPERPKEDMAPTVEPEQLIRETGVSEVLTDEDVGLITRRLGALTLDESTVLAEHQIDAFDDIIDFFRQGGRETYVKLPTSTGKTVLFVEICKRLIETTPEGEERPRVIVLVPTVDLTDQTVGSVDPVTGKRKGFKGFAPELDARAHHSKIPDKIRDKNDAEADVLVTTYDSFRSMISSYVIAESKTREEWDAEIRQLPSISGTDQAVTKLRHEKEDFIREAYNTQEVLKARRAANVLLVGHERRQTLTRQQANDLGTIVDLAEIKGLSDSAKLRKIKRFMSQQATPRIKNCLKWMTEYYSKDLPRLGKDEQTSNSDDNGMSEEELLSYYQLNDYEQFIALFLYQNRSTKYVSISKLTRPEDHHRANEYQNQIDNLKSTERYVKGRTKVIERYKNIRDAVNRFSLIICDEAHRSIGTETWGAIREYADRKNLAILGLTATDEYYDRNLEDYFESKSHDLSKQEAMRREIVNPVALFVYDTGLRFQGVGIDASGDYDRLTIRQMRFSEERNRTGIELAKLLSEHGYYGIIPAIPGDEGAHAKVLAEMLNEQEINDPLTDEPRLLRARYVLGNTPKKLREAYFDAFEKGELDWLTFVDVIREGWDSDRAKAIINMRPTRSPLLATQRIGRIGRTYEDAPVSIAIDLFDGIEGEYEHTEIPPVLAPDVFEQDDIPQGYIIGNQRNNNSAVIAALREKMSANIKAHHTRFLEAMKEAYVIDPRGIGYKGTTSASNSEWQTFEAIQKRFQGFLPKDIVLEAVASAVPTVRAITGIRGTMPTPLFNVLDVQALHADKPEVNPWKLHIDEHGQQWITPEGITRLLSKRFPSIRPQDAVDSVHEIEEITGNGFEKSIGRVRLVFGDDPNPRMGLTYMFKLDEIKGRLVPFLEAKH